jgi:hypothetical protein
MTDQLNIVLVHAGFADGSHWRHITPGLYGAGHRVMAAQNPLTSLADDVENTRKLAEWMGLGTAKTRFATPSATTSTTPSR